MDGESPPFIILSKARGFLKRDIFYTEEWRRELERIFSSPPFTMRFPLINITFKLKRKDQPKDIFEENFWTI